MRATCVALPTASSTPPPVLRWFLSLHPLSLEVSLSRHEQLRAWECDGADQVNAEAFQPRGPWEACAKASRVKSGIVPFRPRKRLPWVAHKGSFSLSLCQEGRKPWAPTSANPSLKRKPKMVRPVLLCKPRYAESKNQRSGGSEIEWSGGREGAAHPPPLRQAGTATTREIQAAPPPCRQSRAQCAPASPVSSPPNV